MSLKPLTGLSRILVMIAVGMATFILVLDYTIANVAIPYIGGDLGVTATQGAYVITSYAVGNAIGLPLTGWLSKRFGRVRAMVVAILGFAVLSAICGASRSIEILVISRFIQGLISGPLLPLSQSILFGTNKPEKHVSVNATWTMIVVVAPVLGPLIGGWICVNTTWPWIFYINLPLSILSAGILFFTLHREDDEGVAIKLDKVGFFLLALGASTLQIVLDKGQEWDWWSSMRVRIMALVSVIAFAYLYFWLKQGKERLLDLSLYKSRSFTMATVVITSMYTLYMGSVVLIPVWLQLFMGYDAYLAGLAVCTMGIAQVLLGWTIVPFLKRFSPVMAVMISLLIFGSSTFLTAQLATNASIGVIALDRFFFGFMLIGFFTPLVTIAFRSISPEKLPMAAGMFHFCRSMSGAIGVALFLTIWERRISFHHERLVESITSKNPATVAFFETLSNHQLTGSKALQVVDNLVTKEAAMLALNDCFTFMAYACIGILFLLPLLRSKSSSLIPTIATADA